MQKRGAYHLLLGSFVALLYSGKMGCFKCCKYGVEMVVVFAKKWQKSD